MTSKEKNRDQLNHFLARDYDKLINYTKSRIYPYRDAQPEDIVQDVAMNIFSKLDLNAPIENLAGYFYQSLRNKIVDLFKKPVRHHSIENYEKFGNNTVLNELQDEADEEINRKNEQEEKIKIIRKAMEKLKPADAIIIEETEFNGKSFEQLSRKWDVPIGTLLSRKHRAIAKIQKIIENKTY